MDLEKYPESVCKWSCVLHGYLLASHGSRGAKTRSGNMKERKSGADIKTRYHASPHTAETMRVRSRVVCGHLCLRSGAQYTPQCAVQCKTRSRTVKTTSCLPTLGKVSQPSTAIGCLATNIFANLSFVVYQS